MHNTVSNSSRLSAADYIQVIVRPTLSRTCEKKSYSSPYIVFQVAIQKFKDQDI